MFCPHIFEGWLNTKLMHDPTYIYKITTLALDEVSGTALIIKHYFKCLKQACFLTTRFIRVGWILKHSSGLFPVSNTVMVSRILLRI